MKRIILTEEQYHELYLVILDSLPYDASILVQETDKWWEGIVGFIPYKVDRVSDREFEVYKNP